jgi:hypothetical protein
VNNRTCIPFFIGGVRAFAEYKYPVGDIIIVPPAAFPLLNLSDILRDITELFFRFEQYHK